jgi:hypothetical protein
MGPFRAAATLVAPIQEVARDTTRGVNSALQRDYAITRAFFRRDVNGQALGSFEDPSGRWRTIRFLISAISKTKGQLLVNLSPQVTIR